METYKKIIRPRTDCKNKGCLKILLKLIPSHASSTKADLLQDHLDIVRVNMRDYDTAQYPDSKRFDKENTRISLQFFYQNLQGIGERAQ